MFRDHPARSGAIIAKPLSNRKTSPNFFGFGTRESFRLQSIRVDRLVQSNGLFRLSLRLWRARLDVFDFTLPPVDLYLAAWTLDGIQSYRAVISEILPSRLVAVVVIHGAGSVHVGPIPFVFIAVPWGTAELLFGYVRTIAANARVIFQRLPGQRVMIVADAEKTTEPKDCIAYLTAELVDHHSLDCPDLVVVGSVNGGSFDLVAAYQIARFSLVAIATLLSSFFGLNSANVGSKTTFPRKRRLS
jgi:hypothetical protein